VATYKIPVKYCYPHLGGISILTTFRISGGGLGNILFPWARALVFAHRQNRELIPPVWTSLKIGTFIRHEKDKRLYRDLFIAPSLIQRLLRFYLLSFSSKQYETDPEFSNDTGSKIIVFRGMGSLFRDLYNEQSLVKTELLKIVHPAQLEAIRNFYGGGINVHIRLGDFSIPENEQELRSGAWNYRIPMKWYLVIINRLIQHLKYPIEINIFSDGEDEELKEILELPNARRRFFGSSIADLLALSRAKVLIGSGSTFSMWASFLGQVPSIWFPGLHRQPLLLDKTLFEGELDYTTELPDLLKHNLGN